MEYFVIIIRNKKTGEIIKRMGPMSERRADKVELGANINLNYEEYETDQEEVINHEV